MKKVSILLCAYNAEAYIAEAIESTLAQTYRDFELIIVDDGSTDGTLGIIQSYKDVRIKVIEGKHDYIGSLNLGLKHCRGEYIARMDADDIMEPTRIATQLAVMDAQPDIAVCTTWANTFGEYNFYPTGIRNLPESPDDGLTSSSKFKGQRSKSYDLSGQRLNNTDHLRKGVYIINGRKVIVR